MKTNSKNTDRRATACHSYPSMKDCSKSEGSSRCDGGVHAASSGADYILLLADKGSSSSSVPSWFAYRRPEGERGDRGEGGSMAQGPSERAFFAGDGEWMAKGWPSLKGLFGAELCGVRGSTPRRRTSGGGGTEVDGIFVTPTSRGSEDLGSARREKTNV